MLELVVILPTINTRIEIKIFLDIMIMFIKQQFNKLINGGSQAN